MKKLPDAVVNFLKKEDGPTAVEYSVMLALIIVVCLVAITTLDKDAQRPGLLGGKPDPPVDPVPVPEPAPLVE